jgi:flagellar basal body-associated protein FliL
MSLENTELKIGNTSFKGIWIAIVLTIGTSIGGTVWTASSLYSRLEAVESKKIPNISPITEKLATLGTNLDTILGQQEKLLELKSELSELSEEIVAMKATVKQGELIAESLGDIDTRMKTITKEIEDLWQGMDYLSNPLK